MVKELTAGYTLSELASAAGIEYLYNGQYGVSTGQNALYYMRARYYNQDIKRFINRDVVSGEIRSSIWNTALDIIGIVWDGADIINAVWYGLEGNYAMATVSAICALPYVGELVGGTVGLALKVIGHALTFGMAVQGTWEAAGRAVEAYQNGTLSGWNFLDVGINALGMGLSGRAAFSEGRKLANRIAASEAGQKIVKGISKGKGSSRVLQTGGRQIDYNKYIKRLDTIEIEYENIRLDTTDISKIAQNTGMPEWKINRIKEHVFFNEHMLDSGINRFHADPEIADAWYRLTSGNYNQNDINLLNHEYFESKFERFYKTDYRTAHNKTVESGRVWEP